MKKQSIVLAADHAGFKLKEAIKAHLTKNFTDTYDILDIGAHTFVDGDDYPEYMAQAGLKVAEDMKGDTKAIIFGGSGQGEAIVANRFPGVRAVVWYGNVKNDGKTVISSSDASSDTLDIIRLFREHNDANVLSIGARFVSESDAVSAVEKWLNTKFSGDARHARRNDLIDNIE